MEAKGATVMDMQRAIMCLCVMAFSVATTTFGAEKTPVTNADVVAMIKAGLPESTITMAIMQGPARFDTSPAALVALKNEGATAGMLEAMMQPQPSSPGIGQQDVQESLQVCIPFGIFQMGDSFGEGDALERPVHWVYVSQFWMDAREVTKALWDEVYDWALKNGYSFKHDGQGKTPDHPVHTVSWFDCVKWCNARSEKEGLLPVYYIRGRSSESVYRTGEVTIKNQWVRWGNNGYRLPTEAEWEKAARGGASGRRFPWSDSDTIDHDRANYFSWGRGKYDTSRTRGTHPAFKDRKMPLTSPVGSLPPNGFGLFDMAGNVWEWCWDWHDAMYGPETQYYKLALGSGASPIRGGARHDPMHLPTSSPNCDPHGPETGTMRVRRGGSWRGEPSGACNCRVALRDESNPYRARDDLGFRTVRFVLPVLVPDAVQVPRP